MNRISINHDVLVNLGLEEKIEFIRFGLLQRIEHFVLIISFFGLSFTGLPQRFSTDAWAQWMISIFGGIEATRSIHHFFAVVFVIEGIFHLGTIVHGLMTRKMSLEMVPSLRDFTDVYQMVLYFAGRRQEMPKFGRYDYKQKFEYWAVVWGWICMVGTGLVMWKPLIATQFMPGLFLPIGKALHTWEAILAIAAIVIWHGYHTFLHPEIFPLDKGIFTGKISRRRMIEEHPLEFEQLTGQSAVLDHHKKVEQETKVIIG